MGCSVEDAGMKLCVKIGECFHFLVFLLCVFARSLLVCELLGADRLLALSPDIVKMRSHKSEDLRNSCTAMV